MDFFIIFVSMIAIIGTAGIGLIVAEELRSTNANQSIAIIQREAEAAQKRCKDLSIEAEILALELKELVSVTIDAKDLHQDTPIIENDVPPLWDKNTFITTRCRGDPKK